MTNHPHLADVHLLLHEARAAIGRVRQIHAPITARCTRGGKAWDEQECFVCHVPHPCPTILALDGEA